MKIIESVLHTTDLDSLEDFYRNTLQLPIISNDSETLRIKVGESILTFMKTDSSTPYHFAFNIPQNQITQALEWLKERVDILPDEHGEIIDFANWNAHSVYFYDPDNNIVELIARHDLTNESDQPFFSESIRSISEMGIVTDDINPIHHTLTEICQLPQYDGNLWRFCALGDAEGLFIVVNRQVKDWFPTGDKAYPSPFSSIISVDNNRYLASFSNGLLQVTPTEQL